MVSDPLCLLDVLLVCAGCPWGYIKLCTRGGGKSVQMRVEFWAWLLARRAASCGAVTQMMWVRPVPAWVVPNTGVGGGWDAEPRC